jgi:hypothetical protein
VKEQRVLPVADVVLEIMDKVRARELDVHVAKIAAKFVEPSAATTEENPY